jgi:hypothetical protein
LRIWRRSEENLLFAASCRFCKELKQGIMMLMTLHVVYECATRLLNLGEEQRLSVFENKVLRSLFELTRKMVKNA